MPELRRTCALVAITTEQLFAPVAARPARRHPQCAARRVKKYCDGAEKMTRACGCPGDGCCCDSDVEVAQRSKRPAEKSRCCGSEGDAPGVGGKLAKLTGDESRGDGSQRDVKLPCGCRSEGDCFHEEVKKGRLPCGCRAEGDCFHEEVKKGRLPCGCKSEGDCFHEEVKRLACGCKDEGDCFAGAERKKKSEKLACGCKSEGDCFHDEGKKRPTKLACGCKREGDCFHEESKKVTFDCGCKSEGDCFHEELKKAPEKEEESCCCASGKPCCQKMDRKSREPCCHKKQPGRLACGCKSEGDCFHEVSRQVLACGCKSEGDCHHEVSKPDPCRLACGCKSEGDCFHEVIKQVPGRLDCGCKLEGDCFHETRKRPSGSDKDEKIGERVELPGPRTDEIYRTFNIPTRFMYPKLLKGYRDKTEKIPHPCYRATSTDYGWFSPTVHTVPTTYYPRDYAFSVERSRGGMYRNCSLNTELDKPFP